MESSFYQSIYGEGRRDGEAEGEAKGEAKALLQILVNRLGQVASEVRKIILSQIESSPETLTIWLGEAVQALDAEAATHLVRKIAAT